MPKAAIRTEHQMLAATKVALKHLLHQTFGGVSAITK